MYGNATVNKNLMGGIYSKMCYFKNVYSKMKQKRMHVYFKYCMQSQAKVGINSK